ncbi:reverse transcriptase [Colletotrichum higginsianum IMI 349063]|uniref:Reverse transcriptase n=1 Tax=Colletotrichum higginsianum (strain IMI 349063) TaxID=759273 RepID=A0A1B7XXE7_COLHI|nr:reverse transcriptase [Colletotrichum higginsianum IMI 349063]OBR04425.1 reverse transcriptase [Colletotrichum higginsianum IMI 349063]
MYLQEKAMAHRARNYESDDYELLRRKTERFPHKATLNCFKRHPLLELYEAAGSLRDCAKAWWLDQNDTVFWENPVSQGEAITKYMKRQALLLCRELWEEFQSNEKKYWDTRIRKTTLGVQRRPVATMGDWGPRNLKRYRGLNRAQSTILIQMRTGFIGLNSFLYPKGLVDTHMCPCNQDAHTVEHLLFDCPLLSNARRNLPIRQWLLEPIEIRRHLSPGLQIRGFCDLLDEFPGTVSTWAIHNFELAQFVWTDRYMMDGNQLLELVEEVDMVSKMTCDFEMF